MKLYYSRGACSLSAHIVLHEVGLPFEIEKVDLKAKTTESGADYLKINPKGYVPALLLDDGQVLTEVGAVLQYIADRKPAARLAPEAGTMPRYRLAEWLTFISSEVHKSFSPLFAPTTPEEYKTIMRQKLQLRLGYVNEQLAGKQYLMGDQFTVADAYLFVVVNWSRAMSVELTTFANLQQFQERVVKRPAVQAAMKAEGLVK